MIFWDLSLYAKLELPSNNELLEKFRTIEELKPFMKKIKLFVQSLKVWFAVCCDLLLHIAGHVTKCLHAVFEKNLMWVSNNLIICLGKVF